MKKAILALFFVCVASLSFAQSDSYRMLRNQFEDSPEVKSYHLSGFICKIIVNIIDEDEEELAAALREVKNVRVMTIPKEEFKARNVTVRGFKSRLPNDNFELMADFESGEQSVSFYHRTERNNKNRYFVIVDENDEVIAMEMKGYIDPVVLSNKTKFSSL